MAKVLFVEDSRELTEMYQIIFKLKGVDATGVTNKQDMARQLILNRPDLILMDVMLKGEDGRLICKELKQRVEFKDIPIILISASPEKLKDYQQYNADDIIEKPFPIDMLVTKITGLTGPK